MHQPNQYRPSRQRLRPARHGFLMLELLVALMLLATIAWHGARYQVAVGTTRAAAREQLAVLDELVSDAELLLSGEGVTLDGARRTTSRARFMDEKGAVFAELPVEVTTMERTCAGGAKKICLTLVTPTGEGS